MNFTVASTHEDNSSDRMYTIVMDCGLSPVVGIRTEIMKVNENFIRNNIAKARNISIDTNNRLQFKDGTKVEHEANNTQVRYIIIHVVQDEETKDNLGYIAYDKEVNKVKFVNAGYLYIQSVQGYGTCGVDFRVDNRLRVDISTRFTDYTILSYKAKAFYNFNEQPRNCSIFSYCGYNFQFYQSNQSAEKIVVQISRGTGEKAATPFIFSNKAFGYDVKLSDMELNDPVWVFDFNTAYDEICKAIKYDRSEYNIKTTDKRRIKSTIAKMKLLKPNQKIVLFVKDETADNKGE